MSVELTLAVPMASFNDIAATLEEGGYDRGMVVGEPNGSLAAGIDMGGITIVPISDGTNWIVNHELLINAIEDACNEAFHAGWEANERVHKGPSAAGYPEDVNEACDLFEVSEATKALIENGGVPLK